MTDFSLSGAFGAGPGASASDPGSQYTLGLSWDTTAGAALWLKGYEFWRADGAVDGPITAETWAQDGTPLVGSVAMFTLSGTGSYQQVLLAVPVPIVVEQAYRSGAHFPDGAYAFTANWFSSGAGSGGHVVGRLVCPSQADAPDTEQGVLHVGAVRAFPEGGSPNAANYYVTPILTDVDPSSEIPSGEVSHPIPVNGNVAGVKVGVGPSSASVALGLSLQGVKASMGAISAPVQINGGIAGLKQGSGAVSASVGLSASVAGQNAANLTVSDVLCSAWATLADVPEDVRAELNLTPEQWADVLMRASEILWAFSGRRWFGSGCQEEATLRSTPPRPGSGTWPYDKTWGNCSCWSKVAWVNGYPVSPFLGLWQHRQNPFSIRLPRDPVTSIVSVTIGGEPFTSYGLLRSGWVERLDGKEWSTCSADTVITYRYGEPPPRGGRAAAVTLGIELARDMLGGACKLPARLTSITRQGVTMEIADSLDVFKGQTTGLTSVDMWLASVNPEARPMRAGVISPDLPRTMRRYP